MDGENHTTPKEIWKRRKQVNIPPSEVKTLGKQTMLAAHTHRGGEVV